MSGTTMSTPSSSASGNMRPPSMTMISSPQRTAMQFMPNSPSPPSGTICSLPIGMLEYLDASTTLAPGQSRSGSRLPGLLAHVQQLLHFGHKLSGFISDLDQERGLYLLLGLELLPDGFDLLLA